MAAFGGLGLGLSLGLTGCIPGVEKPELSLEVPASYRAAAKGDADAAVPALAGWRGFRSPELTGLMESAQQYNLDIAVAIAQIVQADAQAGVSGAALLPSISGSANAERQKVATGSSSAIGGSSGTFSQFNLGLAIGGVTGKGKTEVDAKGLVVAPGFIDVHTHADDIAEQPRAENFVRMGVTTLVAGNCGGSALDIAKFFRQIEQAQVAVNVATLIGHNDVRRKAMGGSFDRPPTGEEMDRMKELVDQAMKGGALGFSTGLIYLPGVFSKTDEIVELAKVAAAYDGIYTSHMRHEDTRIFTALDEVFRVARHAGLRAEVGLETWRWSRSLWQRAAQG